MAVGISLYRGTVRHFLLVTVICISMLNKGM